MTTGHTALDRSRCGQTYRRRTVRPLTPFYSARRPPHRPQGRTPIGNDDLAGDLEAESLVVRHVFGLAGFEIGGGMLRVDPVQPRLHQRLPVAFAPHRGVTADHREIPAGFVVIVAVGATRRRHHHPTATGFDEIAHEVVREVIATPIGHAMFYPEPPTSNARRPYRLGYDAAATPCPRLVPIPIRRRKPLLGWQKLGT